MELKEALNLFNLKEPYTEEESILFENKFNDIYKQINDLTKFKCKIRKLFSNE